MLHLDPISPQRFHQHLTLRRLARAIETLKHNELSACHSLNNDLYI